MRANFRALLQALAFTLAASHAYGVCYDPAGTTAVAGQFRYMTDYKEYRHCDGTYWQSMATRTAIAGGCTAGAMTTSSGDLRMCNGSGWISMTGVSTDPS